MLHKIVVLKLDTPDGTLKGTKGTIVFEYPYGGYEVEFVVGGITSTETLVEKYFDIM